MSHGMMSPGMVAISLGMARAECQAWLQRSFTRRLSRRTRSMVQIDACVEHLRINLDRRQINAIRGALHAKNVGSPSSTATAGSRIAWGFRVAVARGRPTNVAAVRVEIPRAVSSR